MRDDAEKWESLGAKRGPSKRAEAANLHEHTPASDHAHDHYEDSRGGTRTRDPGIMRKGALQVIN
jgi:hypothetical protein